MAETSIHRKAPSYWLLFLVWISVSAVTGPEEAVSVWVMGCDCRIMSLLCPWNCLWAERCTSMTATCYNKLFPLMLKRSSTALCHSSCWDITLNEMTQLHSEIKNCMTRADVPLSLVNWVCKYWSEWFTDNPTNAVLVLVWSYSDLWQLMLNTWWFL